MLDNGRSAGRPAKTRGSGWAGGDPGDGGLRTWSGRERSSHKHRLHASGSTSPALPGPRPTSWPKGAADGHLLHESTERDVARRKPTSAAAGDEIAPAPEADSTPAGYTVV